MAANKGSIVVAIVALATAAHAAVRVFHARAASVAPPSELLGKRLVTMVRQANHRDSTALSDVAPNRCVYLMVTEPSCVGGKIGVSEWARTVRATGNRPDVPDGWFVAWISTDDSLSMAGFYPKDFPFAQLYTSKGTLMNELRFAAVPDYIVLDRTGKVVDSNGGPGLPTREQFNADCSISWGPVGVVKNGSP